MIFVIMFHRSSTFKEDDGAWKGNEDGKIINNQPTRVIDDRNGVMQQAGYIGRYASPIIIYYFIITI